MPKPKRPPRPVGVRVPSDDQLRWITTRAVSEIIPYQEFVAALRSGRQLRLKMGFDPTRPFITLGWAVGLRKLRQLQDLGHQVVLIIGDWTARIGDPSGESQTRPMLSADEVKANSDAVLRQFYRVLDQERTEIRWQSEWFGDFTLADVIRLAARFTVAQMLQRDDFAQRYRAGKAIGIHEFLYPLLQAYDSIAVNADAEFGGTDQKFNLLVGRELQPMLGQRPQSIFLVPLLVGLDGKQKMSQSLGNYIGIEDPPHDMYGKIMSIPDSLMLDYYELLTDVPDQELAEIRESLAKRSANPIDLKMRLAREIVGQFYSPQAAQEAEEEFVRTFRKRKMPREIPIPEVAISFSSSSLRLGDVETMEWDHQGRVISSGRRPSTPLLPFLLVNMGLVGSVSEARRLIKQGAVEIDGQKHKDLFVDLRDGMIIRVGKHRFLRIVDADRHPYP